MDNNAQGIARLSTAKSEAEGMATNMIRQRGDVFAYQMENGLAKERN